MTCDRGDGGMGYVLSDTRYLRANKRKKREQITVFDEKMTSKDWEYKEMVERKGSTEKIKT